MGNITKIVQPGLTMRTLVFATNNENKVREIRAALGDKFQLVTLNEAGILIDIPEPHDTLEKNAQEKSTTIHKMTGKDCFAEDTGLEVEALHGEPGVRSARYAGDAANTDANVAKLLKNLDGENNRSAQFRTIISLIIGDIEYQFEGICKGTITDSPSGTDGFGYDPIFIPDGGERTFAEMNMQQKNVFSHRRKALDKLIAFLHSYNG